MNRYLLHAAAKGDVEPFKQLTVHDHLKSIVTPNQNTVLHVYIEFRPRNEEGESKFVEGILEMCPSLLMQVNAKGDAPLHAAAKRGHPDVVEGLINFAKKQPKELESGGGVQTVRQLLGMTNEERNTALHEAVQHNSIDVVEILMKTDLDFPYSTNSSSETPLYKAAARGSAEMVAIILKYCPSAAHEGPNGKNALHAAVINLNAKGVIEQLLEKKNNLSRERDQLGWTPLHHAAYLCEDDDIIKMLLLKSDDASYTTCIGDEERKMTALHLAAGQGRVSAVDEIIRCCPECYNLVDDRGWNVLHFAMVTMYIGLLKFLLMDCPILKNLINEKDVKGNTPLHLLAVVRRDLALAVFPRNGKGDHHAVNNKNISVAHLIRYGHDELEKEIVELSKDEGSRGQYHKGVISIKQTTTTFNRQMKEISEKNEKIRASHLVVAALIATVAFAAAFTIPGGYNSSDGIAILRKNKAFQAFIISDTTAMLFSLSAVFIHFLTSTNSEKEYAGLFATATWFTMISMGAMVIAFITGTYAMLAPSLGLAITTCLIALCFFFIGFLVFRKILES